MSKGIEPPTVTSHPHKIVTHNDIRIDDYHWLRDRDNPDVISYLEAENTYTSATMARTEELQKTLYTEMLARIKETDMSVPLKIDDYYYYSRTEKGKQPE